MADQYAKAMGLRVADTDVPDERLACAERPGAEDVINARLGDPGVSLKEQTAGDAHRAAVTAVSPPCAIEQPITILRVAGNFSFIGMPVGDADWVRLSISKLASSGYSIRESNVGTRQDLNKAIGFADRGLVTSDIEIQPLENISDSLAHMTRGAISG
jgi:propanol-preferring alcohol dehydrogenase